MQTECSPTLFEFEPVERHKVVAGFDGGIITSDAGGLLLGRLDRGLGLIRRMASCFTDRRDPRLLEHTVETLVGQRVFALALGYEDLNDHDELRHDPLFHVLAGKLEAKRSDCAPVAGKSTLNRLEHRPRARGREVSQDRLRCAEPGSIVRGHLPRWPQASAEGDRARPRRHRRHDPRRARRSVLPWLLRQLLLPAATTTAIATCRSVVRPGAMSHPMLKSGEIGFEVPRRLSTSKAASPAPLWARSRGASRCRRPQARM